jgi:diguanylate cyclase (GGDEF)-like protein
VLAADRADIHPVRVPARPPARPTARRPVAVPRVGLLTRFALVSFVLIVGLGLVVGVVLQRSLVDRTVSDAVRSAEIASRVGITPRFTPADLLRDFVPLDPDRLAEIDGGLRSAVSQNGIVRMKVWNAQHWIVYSDNPRLVSRWFASDPLLERSLAGETVSTVTDLSRPEEMEEQEFGELLAVYVPLRSGDDGRFSEDTTGEIVGAFEVYLPYAPIAAQIRSDTVRLWVTLAVGLVVLYLALFRLVAGASRLLRRQASENERLARVDQLTGLSNRVAFRERVGAMLPGTIVVLLADVDRFQEVNEALGHTVGDEVLVALAEGLRVLESEGAVVARLGGDEFAVALQVVEADADLADAVARVSQVFRAPVTAAGVALEISASVGAAVSPRHGDDVDALMRRADVAMYHAKRTGSTTAIYDPGFDANTPERLALAADVREAISAGQMFLVYQPKMDIVDRRVTGVEALVRWRHPVRGVVPPMSFLPVVEGTELIRPLTMNVLGMALDQVVRWRARGIDLKVAVNLSARVCQDMSIVTAVARELAVRHLPADVLEVELTESALVHDAAALSSVLHRLHDLGVSIAIDDFGTGYASLSYLTSLPVDVVKVDREFVDDVTANPEHAAVVRFTAELGRAFGLTVVAEGVEDLSTVPLLQDLGVHTVQGYGIARPLEAADLESWLVRHDALTQVLTGASR